MRLYVASSWRNEAFPAVVEALRAAGHDCYNFREPEPGNNGFHWSEIDGGWQQWTPEQYRKALEHDLAVDGFMHDMRALSRADAVVMVQRCGVSAALELAWAAGAGLPVLVLLGQQEPDLMFAMADHLCLTVEEVIEKLATIEPGVGRWHRQQCRSCRWHQSPDGTCGCAGNLRGCDDMRAPYQGAPCGCWVCKKRRQGEGEVTRG